MGTLMPHYDGAIAYGEIFAYFQGIAKCLWPSGREHHTRSVANLHYHGANQGHMQSPWLLALTLNVIELDWALIWNIENLFESEWLGTRKQWLGDNTLIPDT